MIHVGFGVVAAWSRVIHTSAWPGVGWQSAGIVNLVQLFTCNDRAAHGWITPEPPPPPDPDDAEDDFQKRHERATALANLPRHVLWSRKLCRPSRRTPSREGSCRGTEMNWCELTWSGQHPFPRPRRLRSPNVSWPWTSRTSSTRWTGRAYCGKSDESRPAPPDTATWAIRTTSS